MEGITLRAPTVPVHICPGDCHDENCPCCLGECDCLGDPYGPPELPLVANAEEPRTAAWLVIMRDRAAHGEALFAADDLAVLRHRAALHHRGTHQTAHERAGESKGRRKGAT